jgi:chemotaxis methyl-accepting protein methylase
MSPDTRARYFTRVDLIACRNLLIYLQPAAQQRILSLFHFALGQAGVLFLGPSETLRTSDAPSMPIPGRRVASDSVFEAD